jgi:hypothetical protein
MKVFISGSSNLTRSVARRMILEGDSLVSAPDQAELVVAATIKDRLLHQSCVGGDSILPASVAEALGFILDYKAKTDIVTYRWFSPEKGFSSQVLIGVPIVRFMNENLGDALPNGVGFASRYANLTPLKDLFSSDLKKLLREMNYAGFVSIGLSLGAELAVTGVYTGVPFYGALNALEGCRGRLSGYLKDPSVEPLMESWTVSVLYSRSPFPYKETAERVFFDNLPLNVEKHFWIFGAEGFSKSTFTDKTEIGLATSWDVTLSGANKRAVGTCFNIHLKNRQFRTDVGLAAAEVWGKVVDRKLV